MTENSNSVEKFLEEDLFARGRWDFLYSIGNFLSGLSLIPRKIKWAHQRVTRGYSDRDMWSADMFLARQIAGTLTWIVHNGHGVAWSYRSDDDPECKKIDEMVLRRNIDYLYYAMLFAEYGKNGPAFNEAWKEEFGGLTDPELNEALKWLSEHFTELWD